MYYARVRGEVVATQKSEALRGIRLKIIDKLDSMGNVTGLLRVAVDTVNTSHLHKVACVDGKEAAFSLDDNFVPVDDSIVGIIDE